MEIYEKQVVVARIREIEQEQLSWLDYVCEKIDVIVDEQKENIRERMLQLHEEKEQYLRLIETDLNNCDSFN